MPTEEPRRYPRRFWVYWSAFATSSTGTAVSTVVIPLLAVVSLKAAPAAIALLAVVTLVPPLLFQVVAGVWADSERRDGRIMVAVDVGSCVLTLSIPLLWLLGHLTFPVLVGVTALQSFIRVWHSAYAPVLLTDMLDARLLVGAQGKFNGTRSATEVAGQGLGGLLASVVVPPLALVVDAVSYLVSAVLIGKVVAGQEASARTGPAARSSTSSGPGTVRVTARLALAMLTRPAMWALAAVAVTGGVTEVLVVYYVVNSLHLSPFVVGLVLAAGGVGGIVGGFATAAVVRVFGAWTIVLSLAATAWAFVPLAVAGPGTSGMLAAFNCELFSAWGGTVAVATVFGQLQAASSPGTVSRTMALATTVLQVAGLVGLAVGGGLGSAVAPPVVFVASALFLLVTAVVITVATVGAQRRRVPEPSPGPRPEYSRSG